MNILIVEDDELMIDLMGLLLTSAFKTAHVLTADSVEDGWQCWQSTKVHLLICDWQLRGSKTGDELVKRIRQQDSAVPIMMLTGHKDRQLIQRLGRLRVNEYIVKPFDHNELIQRAQRLLPTGAQAEMPANPSLQAEAQAAAAEPLMTWLQDPDAVLAKINCISRDVPDVGDPQLAKSLTASQLASAWRQNSSVIERLLRSANRLLMARSGTSVADVRDAIAVLGVETAVELVMAMSLGHDQAWPSSELSAIAERLDKESTRVAHVAAQLAAHAHADSRLIYTAAMLHNLGDKVVLAAACHYSERKRIVNGQECEAAIARLGGVYGNRVKVQWRLPIEMRELMGAAFKLSDGHLSREQLIMRIARSMVCLDAPLAQHQDWARRAGFTLPDSTASLLAPK